MIQKRYILNMLWSKNIMNKNEYDWESQLNHRLMILSSKII